MNLKKTSFLSFIATIIKMISALFINKAVSVFIGPSGIALIGQFQNSVQIAMTVAQGGINSGVTKYTAEYGAECDDLPKLWSTAAKITFFCSLIVGFFLIITSKLISEYVLKTGDYKYIFVIFGFTIILFTFNQLLLSILNGLKEIKSYITINIIQSLFSLVFTTLLIVLFRLDGALIALVTNQSVIFAILLWKTRKHKLILIANFKHKFNNEQGRKLLSYSIMALTTACTTPISLLFIRDYIGEQLSWNDAGYWQSMLYISSMYLLVVTTALSTYYLPRLSEITSKIELRFELKQGYLIIIPIVIILSSVIYFLREFIVWLLFTDDFRPMLKLFKWQLIGDIIKIVSWLLSYLMIAKAMTKAFVISEILFSISYFVIATFFINEYGLIGMSYAYTLNYTLYFFSMLFITRKILF